MCWLDRLHFSLLLTKCFSLFPTEEVRNRGRITFSGRGGCKMREEYHIKNTKDILMAASAEFSSHFELLESII